MISFSRIIPDLSGGIISLPGKIIEQSGKIISGEILESAQKLVQLLREEAKII